MVVQQLWQLVVSAELCVLCRYYVAEGVRLYSQETWKQVTQLRGVQLVERYISEVRGSGAHPLCAHEARFATVHVHY